MRSPSIPERQSFPALRTAFWYAIGVLVGSCAPAAPSAAAVGVLTLLLGVRRFCRESPAFCCINATLVPPLLLTALGAYAINTDKNRAHPFDDSLLTRPVTLIGQIADPPSSRETRTRFLFRSATCRSGAGVVPCEATVIVTVASGGRRLHADQLHYGMTLALRGHLSAPTPQRNPGEFDSRRYHEAAGIDGFLFVRGTDDINILQRAGGGWMMRTVVAPARAAIVRTIDATVGGQEGEFLKGLLLGERSGIAPRTRQEFVDAGVAHVLAVSGSNVAVVAALLIFLYDLLRLPRRGRSVVVAVGLLLYMALTGTQPPVVRATIMALVFLLAGGLQRPGSSYNALGVSALIILLYDARQLFDIGFQLSFAAVAAIVHFYPRASAWIAAIRFGKIPGRMATPLLRICAVSLVATLGTLPLTAIGFGQFSVIGVLANILVVPATGLSVILGIASCLAGTISPWASHAIGGANVVVLYFTLNVTHVAAAVPFASLPTHGVPILGWIPYMLGVALLFHWREPAVVRRLFAPFLISLQLLLWLPPRDALTVREGLLRVHVIDVGQGDAVLVEFPGGETMLVDAGPRTPAYDAGERTIVPYLKRLGIHQVDVLVLTHPHGDHIGGASSLVRQITVRRIVECGRPFFSMLTAAYRAAAAERGAEVSQVTQGTLLFDPKQVRVYVLGPGQQSIEPDSSRSIVNLNNTSIVIRLLYGGVSILLPGDAEAEDEGELLARYETFLRSTMLKAAHHGSATSSTEPFLEAVAPDAVAVSVGAHNAFRHPSPGVMDRLAARGCTVARTDIDGAIIMESDGRRLWQVQWR
ncbi:MAG: DNA internalization-related competence protein ComEC/Rec2 [Bacteroidota bacterium]